MFVSVYYMSSLIGFAFAFMSSLFKSSSELSTKYFINDELNEYVAAFGYRFFALPVLSILVFITGIPEISNDFWIALVSSVPLNVIATVLYMKALKHSDISIVSPIKAMSPMLLLVTSPIMIGEYASPMGAIGVIVITVGVYSLKLSSASTDNILMPLQKLSEEKGAKYALLVMIIYSITSNIDKIGVSSSSPLFWTLSTHLCISALLLLLVYIKVDNGFTQVRTNSKKLLPLGTLSGLGVAAQMAALTYTLVVYVIAIKRTALLWNIIGGNVLLGETNLRERLFGGLLIITGVIIISISL